MTHLQTWIGVFKQIWHPDTKSFRNNLSEFQKKKKRLVWFHNWKLHKYHFLYTHFLGLTQRLQQFSFDSSSDNKLFYYYFVICGRKGTLHWLHWKGGRRPIKKDNCALKCLVKVLIHGQRQHHFAHGKGGGIPGGSTTLARAPPGNTK